MIPETTDLIPAVHPTPIVFLKRASFEGSPLYAKLEFFNPYSNSIKDRPAKRMIEAALEKGSKVIYEASSGNFAIALTLLSNAYGIRVRIYLPRPTPPSTISLLKLIGAEVVVTDFESINKEMVEFVKREAERDGALNLNQFENELNPITHYEGTAREMIEQLEAAGIAPDYLVIGIGTSGTLWGVAKRFLENSSFRRVKIVGVQPAKGSKIPGIKRRETGPKWLENVELYELIDVSEREAALGAVEIARKEGILVGMSAGAAYCAYRKIAEREKGVYVTVFPDSIFKYIERIESLISL